MLRDTFRIWWQKPTSVTERKIEREISFLELFYDLVYVAIVIQLTHIVAGHVSWESVLQYIWLFAMVRWAWINGSLYHELHGNNDIRTRVFTFAQMIALVGMGIFAHNAFWSGYQGFAISYSLFLCILTYLWWRTGVHDAAHRAVSTPYVWGFCVTTIMFIISIFTERSVSFLLWGIAIVFSLILPMILQLRVKNIDPKQREAAMKITPSFVERLWLLTIIILGEAVISTVGWSTHIEPIHLVHIIGVIGTLWIIISVWWIYFDFIARRLPIQETKIRFSWMYLHLFLTMSIWWLSIGILNTLEYVEVLQRADRWMLIAPLMAFLLCIIGLMKTLNIQKDMKPIYCSSTYAAIVSIVLLGFIAIGNTWKTTTILLVMLVLFIPVLAGLLTWIKRASRWID